MCTVSFLPTRHGFMLAMNRDEQVSRSCALAPRRHWTGTRAALYPSETGGGTWIGTNDAGLSLALVNWYAKPQRDRALCVSRGIIIPHLLAAEDLANAAAMFADLPLSQTNPFRLIAASMKERQVCEWRWDGKVLTCQRFGWARRHWFSSGYDEALTNKKRAAVVRGAAKISLTPSGLRKLHQSHLPERGPFSVCMHRTEAKTVSYTEIVATKTGVTMRYAAGSPCTKKPGTPRLLSFASRA
ncbi:MAG: NRDE family protein [Rhizomicrobium sp.]